MKTFIEKCVDGEETPDNVDDYVDLWHGSICETLGIPILYEYLGMTREEYGIWIKNADYINEIIKERKSNGRNNTNK